MTFMHAINNIRRYKERYGVSKAIRAILHYSFVGIKKLQLSSDKEQVIEVNGYKLALIPNDVLGTSSELLMFKTHEPVSTELLKKELRKGMTCLDIGGNIGYYVLLESKLVGENGQIIAIEPSPLNFDYLKKNLQIQNSTNVKPFNIAAGEKDGNLNFLIYENASNSGMIIPEGEKPKWPGEIIKVPVRRIDSILDEIGVNRIDLIRMDVEGYEFQILQGMKKTLEKFKPLIQIEVHRSIMGNDTTKKFLNQLQEIGYNVKWYIPREIDTPMIGTIKDVRNYSVEQILKKLEQNQIPSFFMLSLENKK